MAVADPDAIYAAREAARAAIGMQLAPILQATYEQLTDSGSYQVDGPSIGRRALRNVCLAYIAAGNNRHGAILAKSQFDTWQNMTDVLAALSVLCGIDCAQRTSALNNFYQAWHEEDLVLDKWFAIQAMSPLGTPEEMRALSAHPDFDLRNPNRVRALVSSFASGNPVRFHDASGEGYRFLADSIIALDPRNGQVAARMVAPLGQWRRVDVARQALMQQELRRILELPGLTRNTFEMVSRSLAP
jgi:aminopeptidase N